MNDHPLASRTSRFGAQLVDAIFLMSAWFVMDIQVYDKESSWVWAALGTQLLVLCAQLIPMVLTRGQTIGKMAIGVKVVALDGSCPTVMRLVGRTLFAWFAALPTIVTVPLGLVDVALILRDDKRCLHDLLASTKVVSVPRGFSAARR